jgi:hypothetical protein
MPIKGQQDRHFPAIDKLDFNNYIVAVIVKAGWLAYWFTLKDGVSSGKQVTIDEWTHYQIN